ncbi:hypothetical protein Glove_67g71 [Diversispora epigaea]|uniref:Uncharacterized protein n=1 Tax=Diversispora epigaea TaxID=1348612 RepID=A0A397JEM8_9GLOM|nr:hypothetical protein Glove_67g71 [Diversispora epigaea]
MAEKILITRHYICTIYTTLPYINILRELKNLNNSTQDLKTGNNNGVSLNVSDTKGKRKVL